MKKLDLTGEWEFKAGSKNFIPNDLKTKLLTWNRSTVPGTIHLDLMTNGFIPDQLSDNFFDLHPDEQVEIKINSNATFHQLLNSIRIKMLT